MLANAYPQVFAFFLPSGTFPLPISDTDEQTEDLANPPGLIELFCLCSRIGISGFGGVLPLIRRMLVEERRLMSGTEFNALLGFCQVLPGSNVVNLAVCAGARLHGLPGAFVFAAGILIAPFLGMILLALAYSHWGHLAIVQNMLRGVAAAGAGLLFATALKMADHVRERLLYMPFSLLILLALVILRLPLPPLIIALLGATTCIAYHRIVRSRP